MNLIKLTETSGKTFWMNADRIVKVYPQPNPNEGGAIILHDPPDHDGDLIYQEAKESPERIAELSILNIYAKELRVVSFAGRGTL